MAFGIRDQGRGLRFLLSATCAIAVIGALRLAAEFIIPVMVAFFLSQLSLPALRALRSRGVPIHLGVALTMLANVAVIAAVLVVTVNLITNFQPKFVERVKTLNKLAAEWVGVEESGGVSDAALDRGPPVPEDWKTPGAQGAGPVQGPELEPQLGPGPGRAPVPEPGAGARSPGEAAVAEAGAGAGQAPVEPATGDGAGPTPAATGASGVVATDGTAAVRVGDETVIGLKEAADAINRGLFQPTAESMIRWANQINVFGKTASLFSTVFFIVILMVFMLLESGGVGGRIEAIQRLQGPNFAHLSALSADIQKYLGIKTLVSAATGTLAGLVTAAVGVEGAILWGMVAFVLNFIPAIGSIIAAIPPILVAIVQFHEPGSFGWIARPAAVFGGYVAINTVLGNIIEPMLLGQRFGISTVVVLISVLFWGWMWGPIGMFLAVPLTMLAKVIFDHSADFRWVSVALGKGIKSGEIRQEPPLAVPGDDDVFDPELAGDVVQPIREATKGGAKA